jgi:hypothetical protein
MRQDRNEIVRDPVNEVLLFRIAAHVREGEDGNGRFGWECQLSAPACRGDVVKAPIHLIDLNWPRKVLQKFRAPMGERKAQLPFDLIKDLPGKADSGRWCEGLETRSDIHAISEQIVPVHHHVANVDADPQDHTTLGQQIGVVAVQCSLDGDGCADRLNGTAELGNDAVTCGPENPPIMFGDQIEDDGSVRAKGLESALLVHGHELAVADNIGGQDRGKPATGWSWVHG